MRTVLFEDHNRRVRAEAVDLINAGFTRMVIVPRWSEAPWQGWYVFGDRAAMINEAFWKPGFPVDVMRMVLMTVSEVVEWGGVVVVP